MAAPPALSTDYERGNDVDLVPAGNGSWKVKLVRFDAPWPGGARAHCRGAIPRCISQAS